MDLLNVILGETMDDYLKFTRFLQASDEWEVIRPIEERGRGRVSLPRIFKLRRKHFKGAVKSLLYLVAGAFVQIGIEKAIIYISEEGDQVRIDNFKSVEIKVNGNVVLKADSCTAQQLIDMAKKPD